MLFCQLFCYACKNYRMWYVTTWPNWMRMRKLNAYSEDRTKKYSFLMRSTASNYDKAKNVNGIFIVCQRFSDLWILFPIWRFPFRSDNILAMHAINVEIFAITDITLYVDDAAEESRWQNPYSSIESIAQEPGSSSQRKCVRKCIHLTIGLVSNELNCHNWADDWLLLRLNVNGNIF